jgi:hypothetical protein
VEYWKEEPEGFAALQDPDMVFSPTGYLRVEFGEPTMDTSTLERLLAEHGHSRIPYGSAVKIEFDVRMGQKIQAIKELRNQYHPKMGLREAKELIDALDHSMQSEDRLAPPAQTLDF